MCLRVVLRVDSCLGFGVHVCAYARLSLMSLCFCVLQILLTLLINVVLTLLC